MAAPKGNQFWKLRSKHGRDKLFATPALLWEAACEYFEWCDKNPWRSINVKTKDAPSISTETKETPINQPYSIKGLCLYLDCNSKYFYTFKLNCGADFLDVIYRIEDVIETQQMDGAIVGIYNASIVSRKLGLAERQELTGANGASLFSDKPLSKEELAKRMQELDNEI